MRTGVFVGGIGIIVAIGLAGVAISTRRQPMTAPVASAIASDAGVPEVIPVIEDSPPVQVEAVAVVIDAGVPTDAASKPKVKRHPEGPIGYKRDTAAWKRVGPVLEKWMPASQTATAVGLLADWCEEEQALAADMIEHDLSVYGDGGPIMTDVTREAGKEAVRARKEVRSKLMALPGSTFNFDAWQELLEDPIYHEACPDYREEEPK